VNFGELQVGVVLGLSAAAAPGPFQAWLVSRATRAGPARALPLALVPLASDPPIIAVVLAVLVHLPVQAMGVVRAAGAVVMLGIALLTLRGAALAAPVTAGAEATAAAEPGRGFLQAALVNASNPNVWLFWGALGGATLAEAWRAGPAHAALFLAAFYACITAGNAVLILAAGGLSRAGPRAARALGLASGLALLGFAGWQLLRLFRPA
jgi:threonine/homoserine/homoserine lactone efflux protein